MSTSDQTPGDMDHPDHADGGAAGVLAVLLVDLMKKHQRWGWMRLVAGPSAYRSQPGLLSAKVMGSGFGGGFTLRPSATHQGLLCRFSSADAALDFLHGEQVQAYRDRARECWAGLLSLTQVRGHWDKQSWGLSEAATDQISPPWQERLPPPATQIPLAVLTRASIHPAKATAFWRHAPATQASLDAAQGCLLAMGLGEAPLVRQCTFSLWEDESAMYRYAREGAHQTASAAAWRQQYFSEAMFVHMRVLRMTGNWHGREFGNTLGWSLPAHA